MNKKPYLFTIEPYVHISIKKNNALLYNTLTGKVLEYNEEPEIIQFIKKVKSGKNLLFITLTNHYLENHPKIAGFIRTVRKHFFGDIYVFDPREDKPIQMMPILNVQRDVKKMKQQSEWSVGEDIKNYLTEISLYVNSRCDQNCIMCGDAYKQFLCCHRKGKNITGKELDIQSIRHFINETKGSSLFKINVLGGNIFSYPELTELIALLKQQSLPKEYYIHYLNLENREEALKSMDDGQSELKVPVSFPIDKEKFSNILSLNHDLKSSFVFVVQSEEEFSQTQTIISEFRICDYSYRPYFNGRNLSFFRRYVFLKRREVLGVKSAMKDIHTRMLINPLDFGNLTVLSNGDIHANVNVARSGKLGKISLYDVLYKEMVGGKSWRRIRPGIEPCRNCTFDVLCPPLSNYEYAMKRNNLCNFYLRGKTRGEV